MKVLLLVNPSAGGGRARQVGRRAARILAGRGVSADLVESQSAQHLTDLASQAALEKNYDRALVVGGDGTWHFALNGLAGTSLPGAVIPCGRGNDFRRNIRLPSRLDQALDVALDGKIKSLDLIWTGTRHYIGVGGLGFDSEVTECANTRFPFLGGTGAYSAAVLVKLFSFKPKRMKIVHDNGSFDDEVMFAVFGNSKSYGGGMKITPAAEMDDGLIDVVIVRKVGIPTLLRTMPLVFSGGHVRHPAILSLRTTRAEISSPDKMDLYGDGEFIAPAPVTLEIRPASLRVIVPPTV
ncbi:MAG: diacylglycerol kinase family protein [Pseudomonadota bacterium]